MLKIVKENDFFFLLNLLEVLLYRRFEILRIGLNCQIRKIKHVIQPSLQKVLLFVILIRKLLFKQIIHYLSSNFFSVVNIIFDFRFIVKSKKHPEMFTFVNDFCPKLFGSNWLKFRDDAFFREKIT